MMTQEKVLYLLPRIAFKQKINECPEEHENCIVATGLLPRFILNQSQELFDLHACLVIL
jgi:hypothetical protein